MLSGFDYSNNNNYNISNSNQNYIIQHNQNNLQSMYRNSSNFSNNTNISNKNKFVYYENSKQPENNNIIKKNGKNKTVKFNETVSVIKVESYKKYNKIDDEINIDNILNNDYNYKQNGKSQKKEKNCECKIV